MGRLKAKELSDDDIRRGLAEYESRFGMTTDEFMRQFERGDLAEHHVDFVGWASYTSTGLRVDDPVSA